MASGDNYNQFIERTNIDNLFIIKDQMVTKFHTKIFKYQQKLYSLELQRGRSFVLNPLVDLVLFTAEVLFYRFYNNCRKVVH